jgi:hypothetical protein
LPTSERHLVSLDDCDVETFALSADVDSSPPRHDIAAFARTMPRGDAGVMSRAGVRAQ